MTDDSRLQMLERQVNALNAKVLIQGVFISWLLKRSPKGAEDIQRECRLLSEHLGVKIDLASLQESELHSAELCRQQMELLFDTTHDVPVD